MTYGSLVTMAYERDKAEWSRASSIMAAVYNAAGGIKGRPVDPRELSPYTAGQKASTGTSIKLTPQNLHLLRSLAKKKQ